MDKRNKLRSSESRGNLKYVTWRNSLIQQAERVAHQAVRGKLKTQRRESPHEDGDEYTHCMWTEAFCREMQRLTK